MIHPDALLGFSLAQKKLLVATYNHAWQVGVAAYVLLGRAGASPASPDAYRRAIALAPAFHGVNKMTAEIANLIPTRDQIIAAQNATNPAWQALNDALGQWTQDNAWRVNLGESAAWSGEQAGYGEAADSNNELLEWVTEGDASVCVDCEVLGTMDPRPLSEWPSTPGSGDTECNVGCRCSFEVAGTMPPTDTYQPVPLSDTEQNAVDSILNRREAVLNGLMPDLSVLG